ncbi:MAG: O-antigen ligase family protein [Puniceicoccaceae bacterium]|nr:MAG: O-antigen ligase family protein [Puniceicoccaceae bacterium]
MKNPSFNEPTSDLLEVFRRTRPQIPLDPRESTLVWMMAVTLVFLPWALGTMHAWSQLTGFVLALLCLVVAAVPREEPDYGPGRRRPAWRWRLLLRFPVFWAGLVVLGYVLVQTLNPAWVFRLDGEAGVWWMEQVERVGWLPAGVEAPFGRYGGHRVLLILGTAWMLVCALRMGFTRRKSFVILLWVLALNGLLLAGLGLAQITSGTDRIFWIYEPSNPRFVASFIYKNHAAAYFNLALAVALGMAVHHFFEARRRLKRSDPSGFFILMGIVIGLLVVLSLSRMGTILAAFLLLSFLACMFYGLFLSRTAGVHKAMALVLLVVAVGLGAFGASRLDLGAVVDRFETLSVDIDDRSTTMRLKAYEGSLRMIQDRWIFGWGAGSFRYLYPLYQDREFERTYFERPLYWEFAHSDLLQFPLEYGVLGCLPLLFICGYWIWVFFRWGGYRRPLGAFIGLGLLATVVHNAVDFQFQNPAVLATWSVLLATIGLMARLERSVRRDGPEGAG